MENPTVNRDIAHGVPCDLDVRLNPRLFVQANSGAGKSWLLRRLLEQAPRFLPGTPIERGSAIA